MSPSRRLPLGAPILILSLAARAGLADTVAPTPGWPADVMLNGFVSASFSYNDNRPASGTNQLRVFDFDDNTFKLDEFELVLQKSASAPREAGFRVDATLGGSVSRVVASAGLFRDAAGVAGDLDVHQAFATWVAPLGSGLRLDAGKFVTPAGYEVIDGYDGWNDNATRSAMFGWAIPFTHTGVRASYTLSPRLAAQLLLVNGWDVARDNNRSKTVGSQIAWTPAGSLTLIATAMTGPERTGNDSDPRNLLDLIAIAKPNARLTLGVNLDVASERNAAGPERDATWNAVAGYARIPLGKDSAISFRAEHFADPQGVRLGTAQELNAFTLTPEQRLTPHLLVRADLRLDRSNRPVFQKGDGVSDSQPTIYFQTLYAF